MKALTIWQPWASLIMIGAKPYEFRSWMAPRSTVGKRIVIHAGSRLMQKAEVDDIIERLLDAEAAWSTCLLPRIALPFLRSLNAADQLPLGCGLGTAVVGVSREGAQIAQEFTCQKVNDSDRDEMSNFGWPLTEIERWPEPVRMAGKQGLWNWPEPGDFGL